MGNLHKQICTFMIISLWILLRMRNFPDKACRENRNTHCVSSNFFPRNSYIFWHTITHTHTHTHAHIYIYTHTQTHTHTRTHTYTYIHCRVGQDTVENIIRNIRVLCWIIKTTDTYSECVILIAFLRQQWLRERASILR